MSSPEIKFGSLYIAPLTHPSKNKLGLLSSLSGRVIALQSRRSVLSAVAALGGLWLVAWVFQDSIKTWLSTQGADVTSTTLTKPSVTAEVVQLSDRVQYSMHRYTCVYM